MLIVVAALMAGQSPAPSLDWLSGNWLACRPGSEIFEYWSERRGTIMIGGTITSGGADTGWEQTRIELGENGTVFHASPRGQPAAAFTLVQAGPDFVTFENPAHDFPQRVIYRRSGDRLTGRIEGQVGGEARSMEWNYRPASPQERCPAAQ